MILDLSRRENYASTCCRRCQENAGGDYSTLCSASMFLHWRAFFQSCAIWCESRTARKSWHRSNPVRAGGLMPATIQTRQTLRDSDAHPLDRMADLYGSMKRKLYARIAAHGGKAKSHKGRELAGRCRLTDDR
jgi:hypothetical protein